MPLLSSPAGGAPLLQRTPLCCSGYLDSLLEMPAVTSDRRFANFKWKKLAFWAEGFQMLLVTTCRIKYLFILKPLFLIT